VITEKGHQLLQNLDQYEGEMDDLFNNITTEEAKTLNTLLDKIRSSND